jgi:hypothetical protein
VSGKKGIKLTGPAINGGQMENENRKGRKREDT